MKRLSYTLLIVILFVGLTGCGDDSSTGPDTNEEAPTIPDLATYSQPDISFFQNNNPQKATVSTTNNYQTAKATVTVGSSVSMIGTLFLGYINPAYSEDPQFSNGKWEWSYSGSAEGASFSITTTAAPQGNRYKWTTVASGDDGEGNSYNNLKIMEGTTTKDGKEGQWSFYLYDNDNTTVTGSFNSEWKAQSETNRELTVNLKDNGTVEVKVTYTENSPNHNF